MAEYSALPLFTDSWVADTAHLARAERGLYLDLLVLMWRSPDCRVPRDMDWIGRKLRVSEDEKIMLESLLSEFCQTDGNFYFQKRLKKEFMFVRNKRKKQSVAAKSRWDKEKDPSKRNAGRHSIRNAPSPSPTYTPLPPTGGSLETVVLECGRRAGINLTSPGHITKAMDIVRDWIDVGADPDRDIYPVIAERVARTSDTIASLKYFDAAVRQKVAKASTSPSGYQVATKDPATSPKFSVTWTAEQQKIYFDRISREEWESLIWRFREYGRWETQLHGHRLPGEDGCAAPEDLLRKYGYLAKEAVA